MNPFLFVGLLASWTMIIVGCWLAWQLLRQNGRILLRLDALEKRLNGSEAEPAGLTLGLSAPEFELPDLAGTPRKLTDFVGHPFLLIFFNPDCVFCRELAPKLARLEPGGPKIVIISTGAAEQNRNLFPEPKLDSLVLLQKETEVATNYKANGTPSGYLINAEGHIDSELAIGADALLALSAQSVKSKIDPAPEAEPLSQSKIQLAAPKQSDGGNPKSKIDSADHSLAHSKLNRDGLKAGTAAPEFRLPLVGGGELSLAELRGRPVLLVFSSPQCGPCNELALRLEKFHRKHPDLQIVMISRGEPEENRAKVTEHGLTFPVVLQKHWEISRAYAIFASPVAYLIDPGGIIVADVAVGIEPVTDLMTKAASLACQTGKSVHGPLLKRIAGWPVALTAAVFDRLLSRVTLAKSKVDNFHLKHFKFVPRPDDIFIATYPRSGTTWMQMILYQVTTDGSMDLGHIAEHSPWFEHSPDGNSGYEERSSPRVFKTHLTYREIPKGPGRYIYVVRDGRDVAVSYYNLYRTHNGYKGTFNEFFELFMAGKVMSGSWFEHVGGWWNHRHELNVLFLTYEELLQDLQDCVRRIIAFCHLEVPSEKLPLVIERCSFAYMKQHEDKFDPAVEALMQQGGRLNSFLRSGRAGEGSRQLNKEQQVRFDLAFQAQLERPGFAWPAAIPFNRVLPPVQTFAHAKP